MDWGPLLILVFIVSAYAAIAYIIRKKKLWEDHITFYGPIMAIRSRRVGFFDRGTRFYGFLRLYGTLGAVMVIIVSVATVALLFFSLHYNIVQKPPPSVVNQLQSVLAIPGVNPFIPFTFAVWFAFVLTLVVHEFGHGILARVEQIKVKFVGILFCVIPLGAFVEPDEEEFERTKGISKIRMLGAGITNNMAAGLICFCFLVLLLGMAVPVQVPLIKAVYQDYPAAAAGVPADSLIRSVNGIAVTTSDDVSTILNTTRPGDKAALVIEKEGNLMTYDLTLGRWPDILGARQSGFMGVSYYQAAGMKEIFNQLASPLGFVSLLGIPIWVIMYPVEFGNFMILLNTTVDSAAWVVPFPHYWLVVQIIFWCAWFNITVGLCNAIPMVPFDGGYILKEGVERFLEPRGLLKYSGHVVIAISYIMVAILALGFSLPLLYRAMGIS